MRERYKEPENAEERFYIIILGVHQETMTYDAKQSSQAFWINQWE